MPTPKQEQARLQQEVEPVFLQAPAFEKLPQQLRTKIALGIELWESALEPNVPFGVLVGARW
jgi:hypothetical protein